MCHITEFVALDYIHASLHFFGSVFIEDIVHIQLVDIVHA